MHPGQVGPGGTVAPGAPGDPTANDPPSGAERVGRYDLVRRLGSGGMAEVHLARAGGLEGFEKLVVLKRILPHLSADPHFIKMFLAEARLAAILDHPNVVQVFDLGYDEGDYYFTMEFVYGENLQGILRQARRQRQRLPFEVAIGIGIGAATGLHYAHERVGWDGQPLGIVHRDVSPTNVMVTYEGCVKVADFGIAKVTSRTDVTRAGMRKGKVPYMSPEQCRAEKLDRRCDVFSLGIVLYECSTGTRLFDGDNEFGVMNRIVNGDIKLPTGVRSGYPRELERIVMKALSVDKNRRYQNSLELRHDLERFARDRKMDVGDAALGRFMHQMFSPQPYPWGALMGDGVTGPPPSLQTAADQYGSMSSVSASGPGIPPSSPEVTGQDPDSWVPPPSQGGYSSMNRYESVASVQLAHRQGQLKGIAIALGSVAVLAVLGVGGMVGMRMLDSEDAASPATPPVAEPADADAVVPAADPSDSVPGEPKPPTEVDGDAVGVGDDAAADEDAGDEAQDEEGDEAVVVIEDDAGSGSNTRAVNRDKKRSKKSESKSESKSKSKADDDEADAKDTGKKKPNLDTFLPQ
jgi:serine/threonine protein kinase